MYNSNIQYTPNVKQNTSSNSNQLKTPILLGFGRNTAEYLTITPKHQFCSDLEEIQSNTLQSLRNT